MEQRDEIRLKVKEHEIVLAGGFFVIGFCLFILLMGIFQPAADGNRWVFALTLFCMTVCGIMVCTSYFLRGLTVEGMDIRYVNPVGRKTLFSLDDIGYCKLKMYGSKKEMSIESFFLYDLLGRKLCKLEMNMRGASEFLQYLIDNRVKIEWPGEEKEKNYVTDSLLLEQAVCKEEISRLTEAFYDRMSPVFTEWERKYQRFKAQWEFGLAEYVQDDLTPHKDMWQWESSVGGKEERELPEDYVCVGEAYLKRGQEYVMDRKGNVVGLLIPYIRQTRSYQIGEEKRIRKTDETCLQERLSLCLEQIAKELPRHSYHTQSLTLGHKLLKKVEDIRL